jgi:hypothetical protein
MNLDEMQVAANPEDSLIKIMVPDTIIESLVVIAENIAIETIAVTEAIEIAMVTPIMVMTTEILTTAESLIGVAVEE